MTNSSRKWVEPLHVDTGPGILESVLRYRWRILAGTVAIGLLGYFGSLLLPTVYTAEARIILSDPSTASVFEDSPVGRDLSRYVENEAAYLMSTEVLSAAADAAGVRLQAVRDSIQTDTADQADVITVIARRPDPQTAASLADAVMLAYDDLRAARNSERTDLALAELESTRAEIETELADLDQALNEGAEDRPVSSERDALLAALVTLESRMSQLRINSTLFGSGTSHLETAEIPDVPSSPRPLINAGVLALAALLASGALAWWRSESSPLAEHRLAPAPILSAPLLGEVTRVRHLEVKRDPTRVTQPPPVLREQFQFIASSLDHTLSQLGGSAVLITSAGEGDGKTITTLNLGAAAAADGRRVLLIDGDERRRRLTRLAGAEDHPGLVDLATDRAEVDECIIRWWVGDRDLRLLPAGTRTTNSSAFFRGPDFRKAIGELRSAADLVLVDSPPALAVSETADIATEMDAVVIVVGEGTPLEVLGDLAARLALTGTPTAGYIFNRTTYSKSISSRYDDTR